MITISKILDVTIFLILYEMLFMQPVTGTGTNNKGNNSKSSLLNETIPRFSFDFQTVLKENKKYTARVNICRLRIYGGMPAKISDVPYQVALRRSLENGKVWVTFCGGAIVTKNHVLTAAHCFDNETHKSLEDMRVVAGTDQSAVLVTETDIQRRRSLLREIELIENWREIKHCFIHADYNNTSFMNHDIAVIELDRPLRFYNKVQPIPILTKRTTLDTKIPCVTSGFGIMEHGEPSLTLRCVCVAIVPSYSCKVKYKDLNVYSQICAGGGGKDSCQGDSGSPMACQGLLTGLVSYGVECGAAPGVYTLLSAYTDGGYVPFVRNHSIKLNDNFIEIIFVFYYFVCYVFLF